MGYQTRRIAAKFVRFRRRRNQAQRDRGSGRQSSRHRPAHARAPRSARDRHSSKTARAVNRMAVRRARRAARARRPPRSAPSAGLDLIENGLHRHVAESMLCLRRVMFSERRGSGRRFTGALALALLIPSLTACAPAVGGGVLVAVVAIGALTSHCYDYIDVSVYDPLGRRTCTATVTATNGGDQFELKSCYYAPLTDGHWSIRASLPGLPDAVSTVDVEHENDCTRHVQSMELTINPPGTKPAQALLPPPQPDDLRALPPPPAAPPAPPSASPPALPASSTPPAGSAAPTPATPTASSATPPSVGVFPDQNAHPSPAK